VIVVCDLRVSLDLQIGHDRTEAVPPLAAYRSLGSSSGKGTNLRFASLFSPERGTGFASFTLHPVEPCKNEY
jgi:hypothetical protein